MSTNKDTKNAGGRPPKYTQDQVRDAVQALVEEGVPREQIDAKSVKSKLCTLHDVSEGINAQSLEGPVALVLEELAEEERRSLLKALPNPVVPAVDQLLTGMRKDLLLLVARQNAVCQKEADLECEELRNDKRNANWRIAELEAQTERQAERIRDVESERDSLQADLAEAWEELAAARDELQRQRRDASTVDRLFSELRDPAVRDSIRGVLADIAAKPASEVTQGAT